MYIYVHIYSICTPSPYLTRGGIETICEFLETRSDKSISSNSLCDLASFILKSNYFENEDLRYQQKRGFAIGVKFAPSYSNLFRQGYKTEFFKTEFKCGYDTLMRSFVYGPTQGPQNLNELFNCINSLHPTIKFAMDYSTIEINFLGITVTKVCNKLETYLYCKPNDMHYHLHAQSCYHNVYKISIA